MTRPSCGGTATDTLLVLNPTLKYGLNDTLDVEASFAPVQDLRVKTAAGIAATDGHGDLYLRGKWMFTGDGEAGFTAVAEPFVKLATATRSIGNGALEGGAMSSAMTGAMAGSCPRPRRWTGCWMRQAMAVIPS